METNRLMARLYAAILIATMLSVACLRPAYAQTDPNVLTSTRSSVAQNISQSTERIEMIVKSSRILTLEERIPKFQVYNESVVGASPGIIAPGGMASSCLNCPGTTSGITL